MLTLSHGSDLFISCIMPTYNRSRFIPDAINCFLSQTYAPEQMELVILDDGEVSALSILQRNPTPIFNDPRIRYYHQPGRQTVGEKKNRLCDLARGDVIVQWDDDDWYSPRRVENQIGWLLVSQKPVTGFNRFFYWDEQTRQAYEYRYNGHGDYAAGSTQVYLKEWWAGHHFNPANTAEDSEFSRKAREAGALFSMPAEGLMVARGHKGNTWRIPFGTPNFRPVDAKLLPAKFFEAIGEIANIPK